MWSRRTDGSLYVNSTELEDQENAIIEGMEDVAEPCWEQGPSLFGKDITALTLSIQVEVHSTKDGSVTYQNSQR